MLLIIANFLILNDYMKAVSSIIHEEGYYWNSQHVYRGFTIAFDQSDSRTHLCHVRIGVLHRFQHCTGHIMMGSFVGKGNQYIQLVKVLYYELPTISKPIPTFPSNLLNTIETSKNINT